MKDSSGASALYTPSTARLVVDALWSGKPRPEAVSRWLGHPYLRWAVIPPYDHDHIAQVRLAPREWLDVAAALRVASRSEGVLIPDHELGSYLPRASSLLDWDLSVEARGVFYTYTCAHIREDLSRGRLHGGPAHPCSWDALIQAAEVGP